MGPHKASMMRCGLWSEWSLGQGKAVCAAPGRSETETGAIGDGHGRERAKEAVQL